MIGLNCPFCNNDIEGLRDINTARGTATCGSCGQTFNLRDLTRNPFSPFGRQEYGYNYGMPSFASMEPDEDERKALYWGSFGISAVITLIFLWLSSQWGLRWECFTFSFLFWTLVISRVSDIVSTLIMMNKFGGVETNPLSDPHDIGDLIKANVPQTIYICIISYFINGLSPYLGNGLMLLMALSGFRAAISNFTQILNIIFLPTSMEQVKVLFYINAVVCSILICVGAYFALPKFL